MAMKRVNTTEFIKSMLPDKMRIPLPGVRKWAPEYASKTFDEIELEVEIYYQLSHYSNVVTMRLVPMQPKSDAKVFGTSSEVPEMRAENGETLYEMLKEIVPNMGRLLVRELLWDKGVVPRKAKAASEGEQNAIAAEEYLAEWEKTK